MIAKFCTLVDKLNNLTGKLVSFLIILINIIVLFEIVARYFFNHPTIWVNETSEMLFGAFFLLGGGYTLLHNHHVRIDILYNHVSDRSKDLLDLLSAIAILGYMILFTWTAGDSAYESILLHERSQSVWAPYIFPIKLVVPIAGLLMILQALSQLAVLVLKITRRLNDQHVH